MEKRKSILCGLIGGFVLLLLNSSLFRLYRLFGDLTVLIPQIVQLILSVILGILSLIGLITTAYFSILLILDALKSLHKK